MTSSKKHLFLFAIFVIACFIMVSFKEALLLFKILLLDNYYDIMSIDLSISLLGKTIQFFLTGGLNFPLMLPLYLYFNLDLVHYLVLIIIFSLIIFPKDLDHDFIVKKLKLFISINIFVFMLATFSAFIYLFKIINNYDLNSLVSIYKDLVIFILIFFVLLTLFNLLSMIYLIKKYWDNKKLSIC